MLSADADQLVVSMLVSLVRMNSVALGFSRLEQRDCLLRVVDLFEWVQSVHLAAAMNQLIQL